MVASSGIVGPGRANVRAGPLGHRPRPGRIDPGTRSRPASPEARRPPPAPTARAPRPRPAPPGPRRPGPHPPSSHEATDMSTATASSLAKVAEPKFAGAATLASADAYKTISGASAGRPADADPI